MFKHFITIRRCIIAAVVAAASVAVAALTPSEALVSAPWHAVPLLSYNARLDMIDYYNYGGRGRVLDDFDTPWSIAAITPATLTVVPADSSSVTAMQLAVLPARRDSLVAVITTVGLPAPDSRLAVYGRDWMPLDVKASPRYSDWLTPGATDSVAALTAILPFVTATASFSDDGSRLVWRNTAADFLSPRDYAIVAPLLQDSIVYNIASGKFSRAK